MKLSVTRQAVITLNEEEIKAFITICEYAAPRIPEDGALFSDEHKIKARLIRRMLADFLGLRIFYSSNPQDDRVGSPGCPHEQTDKSESQQ